jgi:glycerol 2-dehydrogenase (NADP+)
MLTISAAWAYQNEDEVGAGIKEAGIPREELWVTSKLFEFHHEPQDVALAVKETLKNLGLEYLDLYLMHWPVALVPERSTQPEGRPPQEPKLDQDGRKIVNRELSDDVLPTWREMEKLVEQGLVKNIGVSNFNAYRIKKLLKDAKIKPVASESPV